MQSPAPLPDGLPAGLPPGVPQTDELVRIHFYASHANIDGAIHGHMESIRATVARRNAAVGVHTALLYQSGWFLQWLEGPAEAVQQILERVAADPRHSTMHVLHDDTSPRELYGSWSMAVVHCDETPAEFGDRVGRLAEDFAQDRRHTPTALWRLLSTPQDHVGATAHDDPSLFCRTLVCSADVDESFDLIRWLGRKHRVEVVRRRFAGIDTPDVGTDYVDFMEGGGLRNALPRVHRVIAMARNGISIGLTRSFMADYGSLVLLRGADPRRDARLVELIGQVCAGLPARPALVCVGDAAAHAAPLQQVAAASGMACKEVVVADLRDPASVWAAVAPVVSAHAAPEALWPAGRAAR